MTKIEFMLLPWLMPCGALAIGVIVDSKAAQWPMFARLSNRLTPLSHRIHLRLLDHLRVSADDKALQMRAQGKLQDSRLRGND